MSIKSITIEKNVLIASNVLLVDFNHGINPEFSVGYYADQPLIGDEIIIGEGSWIGEKGMILPGMKIEKNVLSVQILL